MKNIYLNESEDLEYLFKKYLQTVKRARPNIKLSNQVKLMMDCINIKNYVKNNKIKI